MSADVDTGGFIKPRPPHTRINIYRKLGSNARTVMRINNEAKMTQFYSFWVFTAVSAVIFTAFRVPLVKLDTSFD